MKKKSKKAEAIKKKRNPRPVTSAQSVKKMKCPQCKKLVLDTDIKSIRGQTKCIKCHIEDVWCYSEHNRRTQNEMIDKFKVFVTITDPPNFVRSG